MIGRRIGIYEVQAALGAGGMGEVYRARDTRLGRDVAIKILPPAFTSDSDRLERFEREARVLAALNHPHIGAIYGVEDGPVEGGTRMLALVLELVEGETLAERLQRGAMPIAEAVAIARQAADALDAAHEIGIIHRDFKPANIKITRAGVAKVLDFGLAKAATVGGTNPDLTQSPTITVGGTREGVIVGTAAYMSPEQARGLPVDKRTDIWAFGCVLYEMLTGRRAFPGDMLSDILAKVLEREPAWEFLPASTPPALQRLLRRCLQKNPQHRLRDIGDALPQQDELIDATPETAAPAPGTPWWRTASAVAFTAAIVAAGFMVWNRTSAPASTGHAGLGPRFSRVTWDTSFSTEPAISPDGTLIVYASDRGGEGQLDLWLQRVAGGPPIRLTEDPNDDREPDFSPDGSLIAFRSDRNRGGIYVMPALGGDARLVAEGGYTPRFSPNGIRIAYWTGPWLGGPRTPGTALFTVPANGGQPVRLAKDFAAARNPVWSPDGSVVLFFGQRTIENSASGGSPDWYWTQVVTGKTVATGVYRLLADNGLSGSTVGNTVAPAPDALPSAWTRDGVLFSARLEHSVNVWRVKVSDSAGTVIDGSLERLTDGTGSDILPSPDTMGRLAFQVETTTIAALTMPLEANTGKVTGAIERQATDASLADGRDSLDAAGRLLAYPKIRTSESEVWVKDLMTRQERHIVTTPQSQLNPIISPDGTRVAYGVPENGKTAGYVVAVAGGTPRKACDDCVLQGWLRDSRKILALVSSRGAVRDAIRMLDLDDVGASKVLIDSTTAVGRADPSPDGRWVAFMTGGHVWISPLRPGAPPPEQMWVSVVTIAQGSAERACGWSPDGRLLYLLLERDGFRDLYAQRVDTMHGTPVGESFVVRHLHDPRRRWGSTPYGTAIVQNAFVFNQAEVTGSIWLLDPGRDTGTVNRPLNAKAN